MKKNVKTKTKHKMEEFKNNTNLDEMARRGQWYGPPDLVNSNVLLSLASIFTPIACKSRPSGLLLKESTNSCFKRFQIYIR